MLFCRFQTIFFRISALRYCEVHLLFSTDITENRPSSIHDENEICASAISLPHFAHDIFSNAGEQENQIGTSPSSTPTKPCGIICFNSCCCCWCWCCWCWCCSGSEEIIVSALSRNGSVVERPRVPSPRVSFSYSSTRTHTHILQDFVSH